MRLVALALLVAACQGGGDSRPATGSPPPPPRADAAAPIFTGDAALEPDDARAAVDEPEPPDPSKVIADLGAIPAWQAVVDRTNYLARRGQRGVVFGTIGPAVMVPAPPPPPSDAGVPARPVDAGVVASRYTWLVDDTEGNGTLGIRLDLDGKTAQIGDRVAVGGAWHLDDERRWYWKVTSLQSVPAAAPSEIKDPRTPVPSHEIAEGRLPQGARTISVAKDHDAVYFQIVGPSPVRDGDGWLVADELGDKPVAYLILPGERSAYGGQDMRAPDERWQLKKMQTYWVRIGRIRPARDPEKPSTIYARTAPVLVKW